MINIFIKFWKDSVFSKVISAGIIFLIGYLFTKISKIVLKDTSIIIFNKLSNSYSINLWIILFFFIVMLFVVIVCFLLYKKNSLKQHSKIEPINSQKPSTEFTTSSSYIVEHMEYKVSIELDGSSVSRLSKEIKVLKGYFESIDELNILTGDATFSPKEMTVVISENNKEKNIKATYEPVRKSGNLIGGIITFTPPLESGDSVKFTRIHRYAPGAYFMTYEGVVEQVRTKTWGLAEAKEFTGVKVDHETNSLFVEVTFPSGFEITGGELWDVLVGYSSKRATEAYEKLKETSPFKRFFDQDGNQIIQLKTAKAINNMMYCIKWEPPTEIIYNQVLMANKATAADAKSRAAE